MLTKRIIPCLDVKNGRVVKGVKFRDHRDAGDPVELAAFYNDEGADELTFYDITASSDGRAIMRDVVERTASKVFIPLTVAGGLRTVEDMSAMLKSGADKVSINTPAILNPSLITEGAIRFGSQCIVLGMDAKRVPGSDPTRWIVHTYSGADGGISTDIDAIEWARKAVELGAGEITVNSIDADGTRAGYDLELLKTISENVTVPVIASGGAGSPEDILKALVQGKADAALAATIFHYGIHPIGETKKFLAEKGIPVRV
ncbi:MAG: imidazole glycerol phosphate synthase subunit HisF [Dehalococcoidales bacterium]|nr:MAG: imidazole glycerol phosphate synthase subunit HisF [Dehalococcoidales bacterium]